MNAQKIAFDLAASGETDLAKFVEAGAAARDGSVRLLKAVLGEIAAQETPAANATVKRMARLASSPAVRDA